MPAALCDCTRPLPSLAQAPRLASCSGIMHSAWPTRSPGPNLVGSPRLSEEAEGDLQVGAKCGAFRTLLTHFSQRYPKIPVMDPSLAASTCIASDLMRINLAGAAPHQAVHPVAVQRSPGQQMLPVPSMLQAHAPVQTPACGCQAGLLAWRCVIAWVGRCSERPHASSDSQQGDIVQAGAQALAGLAGLTSCGCLQTWRCSRSWCPCCGSCSKRSWPSWRRTQRCRTQQRLTCSCSWLQLYLLGALQASLGEHIATHLSKHMDIDNWQALAHVSLGS